MIPETAQDEIGEEIARLHLSYYGHGPAGHSVHATDEVVVVLLEETFTQAEMKLIELGEASEVQTIRRRFQQAAADDFVGVVERATGRAVRSFRSDTDLAEHLSIEIFVLGEAREDMTGYEFDSPDDPTNTEQEA